MINKPELLTLDSRSATTLEISWLKPDAGGNEQSIGEYIVLWTYSNANEKEHKIATNVSTVIDNLLPNTVYEVAVAARGTMGKPNGEFSDVLNILTRKFADHFIVWYSLSCLFISLIYILYRAKR